MNPDQPAVVVTDALPPGVHMLIGAFGHGTQLYEPAPAWWQLRARLRQRADRRRARALRFDPTARLPLEVRRPS